MQSQEALKNWSETTLVAPADCVLEPSTDDEVKCMLQGSGGCRPVGSCYSNSAILKPARGSVMLMRNLKGLVQISENSATFKAGTTLAEVYEILQTHGRMVQCSPGVISAQTLGGAVATGTHGQGLWQCSLSDLVESLVVVLADGREVHVQNDATETIIDACRVNLGCLGIITKIEIRTMPFTHHVCSKFTLNSEELCSTFVALNHRYDFCKAWWFHDENRAHVWVSSPCESPCDKTGYPSPGQYEADFNKVIEDKMSQMSVDTKDPDLTGKQFQTLSRFKTHERFAGSVYDIWCKGIPVPQVNVEIAVPLRRFDQAVEALKEVMRSTDERTHYPIILRATGGSRGWLSPAQTEPVCHFGFVVYFAKDGSISSHGAAFVNHAERALARIGGRPHWGKFFTPSLYDFPALYPRWNDFKQLKRKLDPRGLFGNSCIDHLFEGSETKELPTYHHAECQTAPEEPTNDHLPACTFASA